jgi:hypothetical protein
MQKIGEIWVKLKWKDNDIAPPFSKMKRTLISRTKDSALRKALLHFLRPRFERYGEIQELDVNTTEKVLTAEVTLKGEPFPFVISEARYRIEKKGDESWIAFYGMKVSKEWVQNLLDDQFAEIPVKLPKVLEMLL